MKKNILINIVVLFFCFSANAQEMVGPIQYNPHVRAGVPKAKLKTTALTLPFFEDFTHASPIPDGNKWVDFSVYINNTMAVSPVSRGVATFDALNWRGGPYDSSNLFALLYADSLTSQPIDLSSYNPADSIYLSFFYQPQGRGFAPETQDSLMLYLKQANNSWAKVWAKEGTTIDSFKQVMIPVTDIDYFHADFQFRFINKASKYLTDDVWNIDYVRLAANRHISDTTVNDIATTEQPSNMLNDYTSMPYEQFKANMNAELASNLLFTGRNLFGNTRSATYGYTAREKASNTFLSGSNNNSSLPGYSLQQYSFPMYTPNYNAASIYSKVVFENKYFLSDPSASDDKMNDTIIQEQVFDNYLAYDDGTAELSYWLTPFATLPAKTAVEFHLNKPDTLRGVAIYFGRQVPPAFNKYFSIAVYKNITIGSWADTPVYQQDLYLPGYVDTINHFWVYAFDTPVPIDAGTFFVGTIQPAQSGSDSLYFALDINRAGGNHRYVNVNGYWASSSLQGAMMIRPIVGLPVFTTPIETLQNATTPSWSLHPNPADNIITIETHNNKPFRYEIFDIQGQILQKNNANSSQAIDVSSLSPGIYFVRILADQQIATPKKFIKR